MEKLLLTPEEARGPQYLNCGRNMIYALLASGAIPHIRLGKTYRIPRQKLIEWIERQAEKVG